MHLAIAVLTIIASLKWGNWKNWREYHASMFFICAGGLLYEYIVEENTLWKFHPDFLYGQKMVVIVYALITMPISVLIFLSHFPQKWF
jgi:predicted ferric reductase